MDLRVEDDDGESIQVIDIYIPLSLQFHPAFLVADAFMVMGTGMVENINCSVPEVPLACLEDDVGFIKRDSHQS